MTASEDYSIRLARFEADASFVRLHSDEQAFVRRIGSDYLLTFQELRQVCEIALDLRMWGERGLGDWWQEAEAGNASVDRRHKPALMAALLGWMAELRATAKSYPQEGLAHPTVVPLRPTVEASDKAIAGMCPVASEDTVCCNLRTVDAVENCGMACSYCTIQSFYEGRAVFDADLEEKLNSLDLDPHRFYHFGTGQSSDSLMWGNRHGVLDVLCEFARRRPNILLELKTKSASVRYFLEAEIPPNVALSWSLNTPVIIRNEEHRSASLERRLGAARQVADRGIKVAFHFHPIVHYDTWQEDYTAVAHEVTTRFSPQEVLFVSLGSVTFIKPVVRAIRERGWATKMLQMELSPGPKGKLSYPDQLKQEMFSEVHGALSAWHGQVFTYLCMEKAELWHSTFGRCYGSNEEFEEDFGRAVRLKLATPGGARQ